MNFAFTLSKVAVMDLEHRSYMTWLPGFNKSLWLLFENNSIGTRETSKEDLAIIPVRDQGDLIQGDRSRGGEQ